MSHAGTPPARLLIPASPPGLLISSLPKNALPLLLLLLLLLLHVVAPAAAVF